MRLAGAGGGIALILALNTMRIGTLGRIAASPSWFQAFHVYGWPALLAVAIPAYVFVWMRRSDRQRVSAHDGAPRERATFPLGPVPLMWRFGVLAVVCLPLFAVGSPLYFESPAVIATAGFVVRASARLLQLFGIHTTAAGSVLSTARGQFAVTPECILTPLIPVYFAAVVAYMPGWRPRVLALLAAGPLFVALGIARLLVVALPAALVASPLFLVHAFFQLLLGAAVVGAAAVWRHGPGMTACRRALLGAAAGCLVAYGDRAARARARAARVGICRRAGLDDPQGSIALLAVVLRVGVYVAAFRGCVGCHRMASHFILGLGALVASQMVLFAALHLVAGPGQASHVSDVRAWALAAPLLLIMAMVKHERPHR